MENKNNPVKYAILPVKELVVPKFGNSFHSTIGYIVSKAYVLEKNKIRMNNDSYRTMYKVCFPHIIDNYGVNYLRSDNEMSVGEVFDSFEKASAVREERNSHTTVSTRKKLEEYEAVILGLTEDLEVLPDEFHVSDEVKQRISDAITRDYGMTLAEFSELDIDEQHRLIELKTGRKMEPDHYLHIGGNLYHGYCTADDLTSKPKQYSKLSRDKKRTK